MIKQCLHCGAEFGTPPSRDHKYCSRICSEARRNKRYVLTYGPCPTCGKMFDSIREKKYCSQKCYISSPEFLARIRKQCRQGLETHMRNRGLVLRDRVECHCMECGKVFFRRPSAAARTKNLFCSRAHYRLYMAKRFDRWVASPESIALPQNYDEFLSKEELPCLIAGCGWVGQNLGCHVNFTHGIPASEFKRAAGFNKTSGLVTPELSAELGSRPHLLSPGEVPEAFKEGWGKGNHVRGYSLEATEHARKGRALAMEVHDPPKEKICFGCGKTFEQSTPFGTTKFCSIPCREEFYKRNHRRTNGVCAECGVAFLATYYQTYARIERGKIVFCSHPCRSKYMWKHEKTAMLEARRKHGQIERRSG